MVFSEFPPYHYYQVNIINNTNLWEPRLLAAYYVLGSLFDAGDSRIKYKRSCALKSLTQECRLEKHWRVKVILNRNKGMAVDMRVADHSESSKGFQKHEFPASNSRPSGRPSQYSLWEIPSHSILSHHHTQSLLESLTKTTGTTRSEEPESSLGSE